MPSTGGLDPGAAHGAQSWRPEPEPPAGAAAPPGALAAAAGAGAAQTPLDRSAAGPAGQAASVDAKINT